MGLADHFPLTTESTPERDPKDVFDYPSVYFGGWYEKLNVM